MARPMVAALRRNLFAALRGRRLGEAESILTRLQKEDPLSVETRGSELELLLAAGQLRQAARLADQLILAFPGSARVFYLAGRVAYKRKQYELALDRFQESLRLVEHWRTRQWVGKTLTQLGRLEEAEPVLVEVSGDHAEARPALAWLYERMGDNNRALRVAEAHLESHPNDELTRGQLNRLRARVSGGPGLQEEVETLLELGEAPPAEVMPEYIESLLAGGQGRRAREVLGELEESLETTTLTRIAWICHRQRVYDLAFRLLERSLPANIGSVKHLTALESDAARAGRLGDLAETYRQLAPEHPRLWGRLKKLLARLETTG